MYNLEGRIWRGSWRMCRWRHPGGPPLALLTASKAVGASNDDALRQLQERSKCTTEYSTYKTSIPNQSIHK